MKHRFRHYARNGWTVVEVPRANLYDVDKSEKFGNEKHYQDISNWCAKTLPQGTWVGTKHAFSGTDKPGTKRFAFKHPKYATLFTLKWLSK